MVAAQSKAGIPEWPDGLAGVPKTGFFGTLGWVDTSKPAGHTSQTQTLGLDKTLSEIAKLQHIFYSPNLVWLTITCLIYFFVPYDLEAAALGWSWDWVGKRLVLNFGVATAYYGFFFWALYVYGMSEREYKPGVRPTAGNMAHNIWYWSLGTLQLTLSECAMMRLWATGKVPFVPDTEILSSSWQLCTTLLFIALVPVWRDIHFYFAHRFSHIRALYKYVHSLHHRNTDPEPFSGLCMHPVEHLIYFSNVLIPMLYFRCSPFVYLWILVHLFLAPGAGHSGWEDHWQSDQYHYIHHAKFECNYGSPSSAWIDQYFGTFREKLGSSDAYKGEYKENYSDGQNKVWSSQGYLGLQTTDHTIFTLSCLLAVAAVVQAAAPGPSLLPEKFVAALVAYGPLVVGLALCTQYDKMHWRWPFHKESIVGSFGFFAVMGWLTCLLPVYHFVELVSTL